MVSLITISLVTMVSLRIRKEAFMLHLLELEVVDGALRRPEVPTLFMQLGLEMQRRFLVRAGVVQGVDVAEVAEGLRRLAVPSRHRGAGRSGPSLERRLAGAPTAGAMSTCGTCPLRPTAKRISRLGR